MGNKALFIRYLCIQLCEYNHITRTIKYMHLTLLVCYALQYANNTVYWYN